MCGIAGYIGISPEQNLLYQLRLLEYRGYDSAGIAVSDGAKITVTKRAGELKNLETAIKNAGETPGARLGIGHTRWATHGKPNEVNAHPHVSQNGEWVIVHNGIIENNLELRDELKKLGYTFYSATDTETAANLLEYYSSQGANPLRAEIAKFAAHVCRCVDFCNGFYHFCAEQRGVIRRTAPHKHRF